MVWLLIPLQTYPYIWMSPSTNSLVPSFAMTTATWIHCAWHNFKTWQCDGMWACKVDTVMTPSFRGGRGALECGHSGWEGIIQTESWRVRSSIWAAELQMRAGLGRVAQCLTLWWAQCGSTAEWQGGDSLRLWEQLTRPIPLLLSRLLVTLWDSRMLPKCLHVFVS